MQFVTEKLTTELATRKQRSDEALAAAATALMNSGDPGGERSRRAVRALGAQELDRVVFNPQPDWEEQAGVGEIRR
eukprot:SAG11_NODE_108_length_16386_cov_20.828329_10_plen_76_part_00